MNLRFALLPLFFMAWFSSQGQTITGSIVDGNTGDPIMYANILALQLEDSTVVAGASADELGTFSIQPGDAFRGALRITAIGYEDFWRPIGQSVQQIEIVMQATSDVLDEVVVSGRKLLFEQKSDRLVMNVGSIPSMSGNNALQVLQKSPGVLVDEQRNSIGLNGKGEVLVMINNRISRIPMGVLVQQLKGMPASKIDKIELIHQPSAKYDAANAAGIIHIVMKESDLFGFNGSSSLTIGYGQREKLNGNLQLNYRSGDFNLYTSFSGVRARSPIWEINHFREYDYLDDEYYYENRFKFNDLVQDNASFDIGLDYRISDRSVVGVLFGYSKVIWNGDDQLSRSKNFINGILQDAPSFLIRMENPNQNNFFNVNYSQQLSEQSSFNIDLDRVVMTSTNRTVLDGIMDTPFSIIDGARLADFEIHTGQINYTLQTQDQASIEVGAKGTFTQSNAAASISSLVDGEWSDQRDFNQDDDISENILAFYVSYKKKWCEKCDAELGARYERYRYDLDASIAEQSLAVEFNNLFPVVRFGYQLDSTQTLNLSFNRRTNRAPFWMIAGFFGLFDPSLVVYANTQLRPSFTNAIRLAFQKRSFLWSIEANRTKGSISFYNTVDKENHRQTSIPTNFDRMDQIAMNINFPIYLTSFWETSVNLSGSYNYVEDSSNRPLPFKIELFSYALQLNNSFNMGSQWTANIDARHLSPFLAGDQELFSAGYINLGISKKFDNGHALGFSLQDLMNRSSNTEWEYNQPELGIRTYGFNVMAERTFLLTYSLSFGDDHVKAKRTRTTSSQEERARL